MMQPALRHQPGVSDGPVGSTSLPRAHPAECQGPSGPTPGLQLSNWHVPKTFGQPDRRLEGGPGELHQPVGCTLLLTTPPLPQH